MSRTFAATTTGASVQSHTQPRMIDARIRPVAMRSEM
jgi:hypothetical protein